ncbi:MAG TPA: hypothetical protein VEC99_05765 [Clostridia bacterium]|nr:hypothetical protein [Clostridia bacterium]
MNAEPVRQRATALAYVAGILGAFLIVAALVWTMVRYNQPAPLGEDRAAVRAEALAQLRAAETEALNTTAWLDKPKGIVRLRIEDAMRLVEQEWGRNPAAARSNLLVRVEKATATPPKAPEQPSQFE